MSVDLRTKKMLDDESVQVNYAIEVGEGPYLIRAPC